MSNILCNRCYEKEINKKLFSSSKEYNCYLCKDNIFYTTKFNINNDSKEILFNKKNNNKDCCIKKCLTVIEKFEKTTILICPKCVLQNNKININNYTVVKPDKICLMCNVSLCSSYNFHNNCFNKFIQDLKENDL